MILEERKPKEEEDQVWWVPESSRNFPTKSACKLLFGSSVFLNHDLTSLIWKGNSPKKVKFFIWSLAHGNLNTLDRVQRRHPNLALSPSMCLLCNKSSEISNHLSLRCHFASRGWMYVKNLFDLVECPLREVNDGPFGLLSGWWFKKKTRI